MSVTLMLLLIGMSLGVMLTLSVVAAVIGVRKILRERNRTVA